MADLRDAIVAGRLTTFADAFREAYKSRNERE